MIGIIYKFTIVAKFKMNRHRPFYIGQHWTEDKDELLKFDYPYIGSGTIWNNYIKN